LPEDSDRSQSINAAVFGKKNCIACGKYALKMSFQGPSRSALGNVIQVIDINFKKEEIKILVTYTFPLLANPSPSGSC
jgi:hypothetical protein